MIDFGAQKSQFLRNFVLHDYCSHAVTNVLKQLDRILAIWDLKSLNSFRDLYWHKIFRLRLFQML